MKGRSSMVVLGIAIALSAIGLAYAGWIDRVYIEGVAEMGSLTLAYDNFEPPICTEFHELNGSLEPGEYLGKDVASCSARYNETVTDVHTGKWGYKVLCLTVNNSYPCLHVRTTYILHNIGTIPIDIYGYNITGVKISSQTGLVVYTLLPQRVSPQCWYLYEDVNDNGVVDASDIAVIWMCLTNTLPVQIDPCTVEKREWDIHFLQEAQQCHIYKMWITIDGIQWNKVYETK